MNSELRQDLVSGDWIVVASGRSLRPAQLVDKLAKKRKIISKVNCPFEDLQKTGHGKPFLEYGNGGWQVQVVENKYPALIHGRTCASVFKKGPYLIAPAIGHHELVVTRDHYKNFVDLSLVQATQVFEACRDRYLMFLSDSCVSYVSIFHNWGPSAGASIYHPHYQIIAISVLPPDVQHSLNGSHRFFKESGKCVHCVMLEDELEHKKRIIYENDGAVAFAPFFSREPFEIRIFPKRHLPYFENTLDYDLGEVADALQHALRKIKKNLKDPDYNFFIHTAPIKDKEKNTHYHWHIEVRPKITIPAGFELGTGIEINIVDPDDAAKILKK